MAYDTICHQCRSRPVMDRCGVCEQCWYAPRSTHTRECEDNAFMVHAATGGDAGCICSVAPAMREGGH